MSGLDDLAHRHTELSASDLDRLRLLLADWQLLADLSFSDLVLWLPTWNRSGYVAVAQLRPTTGPTFFADDLVGTFLPRGRNPAVDEALAQGRVVDAVGGPAAVVGRGIPVPGRTGVIGVVAQHTDPSVDLARSRLEETYVEVARRLAGMVAEGTFPPAGSGADSEDSPRVGDGLILLDAAGLVAYASPNALSAYRRLGLAADLVGAPLAETSRFVSPRRGAVDEDPTSALRGVSAGSTEIEAKGAVVALRTIPLLEGGRRTGALVLLRDVSDVRRRERELVTKDATIREIHHRVKNNLQTVAALLRLQARRVGAPDAVAALVEAERRVGTIALVHETLSASPDPDVPFDEIADRLLAMVTDMAADPDHAPGAVVTRRAGSFGRARRRPGDPARAGSHRAGRRTLSSTGWPAGVGRSRSGPSGWRVCWWWPSRTMVWGCRPTSTTRPQPGWACRSPGPWWLTWAARWSSVPARAAAPAPSYGCRCAERLSSPAWRR